MDRLDHCAKVVRDSGKKDGKQSAVFYVDPEYWVDLQAAVMQRHKVQLDQTMKSLEIGGVPVKPYEFTARMPNDNFDDGGTVFYAGPISKNPWWKVNVGR